MLVDKPFGGHYVSVTSLAAALAALAAAVKIFESRSRQRQLANRQVFIVYSRPDMQEARLVGAKLRQLGLAPWLDLDELHAGQNWREAVSAALHDSVAAIVLLSPNFMKSTETQEELRTVLAQSVVIPVRIGEPGIAVPPELTGIQIIDLEEPTALRDLRERIETAAAQRHTA
jgi:hypothetical protein